MARQVVLFILLLVVLSLPGQKHAEQAGYKKIYDDAGRLYASPNPTVETDSAAVAGYHKVIHLLAKSSGLDSIIADSYIKAGILEMTDANYPAALQDFISSIRFNDARKTLPDSALFQSYLYAGSIYYSLFNLDSALYYYRHAENIVNSYPAVSESERLYNKLGALYYETGDFKKSILYFEKALSLVEAKKPVDTAFIVNYKNNIASALRKLRRYNEALTIYKSLVSFGFKTQELLYNIGVCYVDAGKPEQAIAYLNQLQGHDEVKYNDLTHAYINLHRFDSADYFLQKVVATYNASPSDQKNQDYGTSLKYFGDLLMARHLAKQAVEKYHEAIIQIDPDFSDHVISSNPTTFYGLHNSYLLFDVIKSKADAFVELFADTKDRKDLIMAFDTYASCLALAQHVRRMYHSDEAKLFLEENVSRAYKASVELGLQLYELTKDRRYLAAAFSFAENSKASVLQADLQQLELNDVGILPENVRKEQYALTSAIARLDMQVSRATDSNILKQLQSSLRDQEVRLSLLQDRLEANPKYYQLKFGNKEINIDSIQQKILTTDEALVSYYYYKNKLVCFYITRSTFGYYSSRINDELFAEIEMLRRQLHDPAGSDREVMNRLSVELYKTLFTPIAEKLSDNKRLVIIPYNELNYIPFEVLAPSATERPLVYNYSISYNYSANFLSTSNDLLSRYNSIAMAPFASGSNEGLPQLTASKEEVEGLQGKLLIDTAATKHNFFSFYDQYPVVHLATHAVVNDSFPLQSYIAFYGQQEQSDTTHRLYEQEIYHLNMQKAQLVILSACETGTGQLISEEGIISLSRAFSYAGCKSVITSLWKADDAATAFIIKRVHSYLKTGLARDAALQRAKIDYLQSDEIDARFKTPAYWAHLVLIGNNKAIVETSHLFYWLAAVVFALLAVVILKRNRTQKVVYGRRS